jgi:hypothetical protein
MTILDNLSAEPKLSQVYGRMGFKPNKVEIPKSMQSLVDEAIQLGRDLVKPKGCYEFRPIKTSHPHCIEVERAFSIESAKVFKWMEGCTGMYMAAVTLGPGIDDKVAELSNSNDLTRAFLLNAFGAEAAEAVMIQLNNVIIDEAEKRGLRTTKRYSPGYGDWHLPAQRELLGTLQAAKIGINLTAEYIMIPEKSVSAIMGAQSVD